MHRHTLRHMVVAASCTALVLAACSRAGTGSGGQGYASENASSLALITHNVSYTGVVEQLGVSIYQQGTHKLRLSDGRFILLSASDQNLALDRYLGRRVDVRGSVQTSVEGSVPVMSVEQVTVEEQSSAIASSPPASAGAVVRHCGGFAGLTCDVDWTCVDDPTDSCDPAAGGADCGGICVRLGRSSAAMSASQAASSSAAPPASAPPSRASSRMGNSAPSSESAHSSAASEQDALREQQVLTMARQTYADALWTQKYCTSHIGFCIPVHKNWYYTSFGSRTTSEWHVEFGMGAIENPGDGVILLNLVAGHSPESGDGRVVSSGNDIVGYRDWEDRHFEISADARLVVPVQYMVSHIEKYVPAE